MISATARATPWNSSRRSCEELRAGIFNITLKTVQMWTFLKDQTLGWEPAVGSHPASRNGTVHLGSARIVITYEFLGGIPHQGMPREPNQAAPYKRNLRWQQGAELLGRR